MRERARKRQIRASVGLRRGLAGAPPPLDYNGIDPGPMDPAVAPISPSEPDGYVCVSRPTEPRRLRQDAPTAPKDRSASERDEQCNDLDADSLSLTRDIDPPDERAWRLSCSRRG